ncbi:hypothetical protein [Flexithrix dorotheae]|uniref:hypothetical protein n=1 Tax=Flexithrix dorotheae TaxID=70993 RepID=UPI00037F71E6|nr:hypothetical protein [Flexithrix dorotheae]
MKIKKFIARVLSYGGFILSGIFAFVFTIEPAHHAVDMIAPFVAAFSLASGSTWWLRKERNKDEEINLLKFVIKNGGKATLGEIVAELEIPVERVRKTVDKLQKHGALGTNVSDDGELVYSSSQRNLINPQFSF